MAVKPTYDFQQEILKNGEDIEVLGHYGCEKKCRQN